MFEDEKKPKPLPSSLRNRRRYIAFELISEEKVEFQDLSNSIWHSMLNLLGELGASQAEAWIARDIYDSEKQTGIMRCTHDTVEQVRTSLALIDRIGDTRVIVRVLGISGSIDATKMKFFSPQSKNLSEFV
jgi:ribonuclease P/MRP protein subunit POP5